MSGWSNDHQTEAQKAGYDHFSMRSWFISNLSFSDPWRGSKKIQVNANTKFLLTKFPACRSKSVRKAHLKRVTKAWRPSQPRVPIDSIYFQFRYCPIEMETRIRSCRETISEWHWHMIVPTFGQVSKNNSGCRDRPEPDWLFYTERSLSVARCIPKPIRNALWFCMAL